MVGTVSPRNRTAVAVAAAVAAIGPPGGGAARDAPPGCRGSDRHPVTSHNPRGGKVLVPSGARSVLLCRYRGLNPRPDRAGTLARTRRITGPTVLTRLLRE